jgi:hypothetical protein
MMPFPASIVATALLKTLQVPPGTVAVSVTEPVVQSCDGPPTTPTLGKGATIMGLKALAVQPADDVTTNVTVALPATIAVSTPVPEIVATAEGATLQTPDSEDVLVNVAN